MRKVWEITGYGKSLLVSDRQTAIELAIRRFKQKVGEVPHYADFGHEVKFYVERLVCIQVLERNVYDATHLYPELF